MKKSLLALAVLGAFAGVASAQSSVTSVRHRRPERRQIENGDGQDHVHASNDGFNSSRLGFRGVEDLGGGLSAGFWIEGAMTQPGCARQVGKFMATAVRRSAWSARQPVKSASAATTPRRSGT